MKNNIFLRKLIFTVAVLVFSLGMNTHIIAQAFHIEIDYRTQGTIVAKFSGKNYKIEWKKVGTNTKFKQKIITSRLKKLSSIFPPRTVGRIELKITGITSFRLQESTSSSTTRITKIISWGNIKWESMQGMFQHESKLTSLPSTAPDLSKCTDMSYMFNRAIHFKGNNLSSWEVSNVENMKYMFANAKKFIGDITNWKTNNVKNMQAMFSGAEKFNHNINTKGDIWDVSNVENMSAMFSEAKAFSGDISNWNTGKVTDMAFMFSEAENFSSDIANWNTSQVQFMNEMFAYASSFNQNLKTNGNRWNVEKVENMKAMFSHAKAFRGNISNWNTGKVTDMSYMFFKAEKFDNDISKWNVSSVENMEGMFKAAKIFDQDISQWNTSKVTNMKWMFDLAEKFNQDLKTDDKKWDVSKVTNMYAMFWGTKAFNGDISNWNTSNVADMKYMFSNTKAFNGDISSWNTKSVTSMRWMFQKAEKFDRPLDKWDISKVNDMGKMLDNSGLSTRNFDNTIIAWGKLKNKRNIKIGVEALKYCSAKSAMDEMEKRGWKFEGKLKKECNPTIAVYKGEKSTKEEFDSGAEFNIGTFSKDKLPPPMTFTVENNGYGTLEISKGYL